MTAIIVLFAAIGLFFLGLKIGAANERIRRMQAPKEIDLTRRYV